jgi:hypothetical protein
MKCKYVKEIHLVDNITKQRVYGINVLFLPRDIADSKLKTLYAKQTI